MAERLVLIQQSARTLRLQAANVSIDSAPSLEDDMADIGVAIFNGIRQPLPVQELACEM